MDQRTCGVLKGRNVRLAGSARVGLAGGPGGLAAAAGNSRLSARIIEQRPGQAVVEIVCDCGQTIQLQCTYDAAPGAGDVPAQGGPG